MRDIVIIAMIGVCFILATQSRIAGLFTYWWFGIFRPHDWVWSSLITDLKLPLIAALLLIIPCILQRIIPRINHLISVLMILMLGALLLAKLLNGCENMLGFKTTTFFSLFLLFYIVLLTAELVDNKKKLFWFIAIISISIAAHSAKGGIHALLTGANNYGAENLTGLFAGSNAFALGTGVLLFFMIFTFQFINSTLIYENTTKWYNKPIVLKIYKILFIVIILGSFYNIVSLQSRGSFIATILGIIIWIALHKYRFRIFIITSIIVVLGLSVIPLPEGYNERIASAFVEEEARDNSAASRPHFWKVAVDMVEAHPLGIGPGCFQGYYNRFDSSNSLYGSYRSVHSSHFQILAEAGYFGFFIWVCLMLVSYWKLYKIKNQANEYIKDQESQRFYIAISNMLICSITVFIVGGAFYEYAYNDLIWLIFGLTIAVERNINKDIAEEENLKKVIKKRDRSETHRPVQHK